MDVPPAGTVYAAVTLFLKNMLSESLLCVLLTREDDLNGSGYHFIAVTDDVFSERIHRTVDEVTFRIHILPYERLPKLLSPAGRSDFIRALASAKPLFDIGTFTHSLVSRAQAILAAGPGHRLTFGMIVRPIEIFKQLEAHHGDSATASLLVAEFVQVSLHLFLARKRLWPADSADLLSLVECGDQECADAARAALSHARPWSERLGQMKLLYERAAGRKIDEALNLNEPRQLFHDARSEPISVPARRVNVAV